MNQIILKDYSNTILQNINFIFDKNISLIGTTHSGKTTLLKVLEEKYNVSRIYKNFIFFHTSIEDEIKYLILDTKQKKLVSDMLGNIDLKMNPNNLKNKEKIKLCILKGILDNNGFISFDNILIYLTKQEKNNILDYLKKNDIKFIIVSNDLNDLFETNFTYILNEGQIIAYGPSDKILLEEKLLKRLGFSLPFMIDLSLQLKDYNLIKKVYLDKESLVNKLWK
jgi:ABC-type multidrug transport system ATPase subunit